MGTPPISPATEHHIALLFAPADREDARILLRDECGNNLPFLENAGELDMDRFRFAALKLSDGSLDKLRDALRLANIDWRNLLVAAGFANDIQAHASWLPAHRRHANSRKSDTQ